MTAGATAAEVVAPSLESSPALPAQQSLALVNGEPLCELPQDLYIPPDALEVFLEAFEGPLDLLLYLIRKQNLDVLNIPIARITEQYMEYVELMAGLRLELAAEYLVMAATLAEIKSRMLLPRPPAVDEDEDIDPRAELVRRLQQYERFKKAAADIDDLERLQRDVYSVEKPLIDKQINRPPPEVDLRELLLAMQGVMKRVELTSSHKISQEPLSVRERMTQVLERLSGLGRDAGFTPFAELFDYEEGRAGVVVTFLAILELVKEKLLLILQNEPYGDLHVKPA